MWTHGVGLVLAILGAASMLAVAWGDRWRCLAAAVFGLTLILLYAASTIYHAFSCPRWKPVLQVVDHACIYLLIAGSYTPITLVALRGPWGWTLLAVIWSLAFAGVILKARMRGRRESAGSTALYLVMGWLIVLAIHPLIEALPWPGLLWLVAGGLFYSLGVGFFVWQRLRFNHAIWHGFVILGSTCHVIATRFYILA